MILKRFLTSIINPSPIVNIKMYDSCIEIVFTRCEKIMEELCIDKMSYTNKELLHNERICYRLPLSTKRYIIDTDKFINRVKMLCNKRYKKKPIIYVNNKRIK